MKDKILSEKFTEDSDPVEDLIGIREKIIKFVESQGYISPQLDTCLAISCEYGKASWVKYLLKLGADIRIVDYYGLRYAIYYEHVDVVETILENIPLVLSEKELAYFIELAKSGAFKKTFKSQRIIELLDEYAAKHKIVKENVNEKFTEDSDPVEDIIRTTRDKIKEFMQSLGYKGNIDSVNLAICAEHGKLDWVKFLVSQGANIHIDNHYALRWAARNGHTDVVKYILEISDPISFITITTAIYGTKKPEIDKLLKDYAERLDLTIWAGTLKENATNIRKAYVFDLDDTLIKTDAKIKIYRNGTFHKSLTPKEYNFYVPNDKDTLDFSDFQDGELILQAKKYKMWPVLVNINDAIKQNRSSSQIYILTARDASVKTYIYQFLKQHGIKVNINNILTIGDNTGKVNIAASKKKALLDIKNRYNIVTFFDDDPKNIALAGSIAGIKTRLVENQNNELIMNNQLRDCPFCGSKITREMLEDTVVVCSNCGSSGPEGNDPEDAFDKWNGSLLREQEEKFAEQIIDEEAMGGVSAPMATLNNVPGAGNVVPASQGQMGSGDRFDNTINKKPYTQGKPPKKKRKLVKKKVEEQFREDSDPVEDLGIGQDKGLWGYSIVDAAEEIWATAKPHVQRLVRDAQRGGRTYVLDPVRITKNFCEHLAFEPSENTLKQLIKLVKVHIQDSIYDKTLSLNDNVKVLGNLDEQNINPYDKIGMSIAKKMGIKPPFKKKKEKENQNAMKQRKFEHQIITLDQYLNVNLNEQTSEDNTEK